MALTSSQKSELGSEAPNFDLPSTEGRRIVLSDFYRNKGVLVAFLCNHCPYVQAVFSRMNHLAAETQKLGIQWVGINSNDADRYPADSFEAMKEEVRKRQLVFPYCHDEDQSVAKAYGALCTPEFYLYQCEPSRQKAFLFYHGRFDDNWKEEAAVQEHSLKNAMDDLLAGRSYPLRQQASMGCSIKWR